MKMKNVWSQFPREILESAVLPRLPLASVCRFKAVCKKWKELISHRDFISSHTRASPPEPYVIFTVRCEPPFDSMEKWDVLDMVNNKIVFLSDNFLHNYVKREQCIKGEERKFLAADGGLYFMVFSFNNDDDSNRMFLVCNPVLRTAKVLPPLSEWDETSMAMNMSTDRVSMEYKIMAFHLDNNVEVTLDLYESRSGAWRRVAAKDSSFSGGMYTEASMSLKYNSLFYMLDNGVDVQWKRKDLESAGPDSIWRMNFEDLVVLSQGRLYSVVARQARRYKFLPICIFKRVEHVVDEEEGFEGSRSVRIAEMPKTWVKQLMEDVPHRKMDNESIIFPHDDPVVATGCGSSILLFSCSGRCVAYNVDTKSWHRYADINLLEYVELEHSSWCQKYLFCSSYCLSLCPP